MSTATLLNLDDVKIDPAWALKLPPSLALRRQVLPLASLDGQVHVAFADPGDTLAVDAVQRFLGQRITVVAVDRESLQRALARVYADAPRSSTRMGGPLIADSEKDDPVALSGNLLHAAVLKQASDIHIEPGRESLRIRFRVDGVLEEYLRLPVSAEAGLVSRLKVMSGMDIAEKRAPQDGGFTHRIGAGQNARMIDVRAASLPTKYGEKMTLRLLMMQTNALTLQNLGMSEPDLQRIGKVLDEPHGLILLTGPTGSGKTTTLYSGIHKLVAGAELNIITIEDPIEYDIPGVSQVEVDSAEKVSFHKALRSVLRHDPDVLMIGEIRDMDTLDVAVKSALTGHLVLSTLHTNSAASAVTRLADMGLQRYLIAATLRLCVAQRLVRKLCTFCRKPREMTKAEAASLGQMEAAGSTVYDPGSCLYCAGRGYSGRLGLFEMFMIDEELSNLIAAGATETQLVAAARAKGAATLLEDAMSKVLQGRTSVRDVLQVVTSV
ncbi:MAG TPA: GspE/PulE family protein [Planctomycetota bacterium]|nr:GspE/PulE family protein [Planctomycetota bacterium]